MLKIYIFFVLISITIFITNSELSEEIKKNMKFVCGEAVVFGGGSGHINGPADIFEPPEDHITAVTQNPYPKNFTVKKPMKKEDNLTMKYGGQCGHRPFLYPVIINICDTLDSQSDDEKTNLYKALIDLLGFNVSNCPIPEVISSDNDK